MSHIADDWFADEVEKPIDEVTMAEVEKLCEKLFQQKRTIEDTEEVLKTQKEILDKTKTKLLSYLTHFKKDNYRSAFGMIVKVNHLDVRVEDKFEFAKFLQEKNLLQEYMTFNAMKVKGLCSEEIELATKEGKEFAIPGIGKPTYYEKLTMKK